METKEWKNFPELPCKYKIQGGRPESITSKSFFSAFDDESKCKVFVKCYTRFTYAEKEVDMLQKLKMFEHNQFVLLDYFSLTNTEYLIVTKFIDGLTLDEYIMKKKTIQAKELDHLAMTLFRNLTMIHSISYAHNDIRGRNIMIVDKLLYNNDEERDLENKPLGVIIDFDCAYIYEEKWKVPASNKYFFQKDIIWLGELIDTLKKAMIVEGQLHPTVENIIDITKFGPIQQSAHQIYRSLC